MSRARSKPVIEEDLESGAPVEQCLLVQEEIWRAVSDAAREESPLSLARQVRKIVRGLPAAGFSTRDIADALVYAAVERGVVVDAAVAASRQTLDISGLFARFGNKRPPQSDPDARATFDGGRVSATP